MAALLSKERIVAPLGFNRWRILPAVLGIELSIGQIYAFSGKFHIPDNSSL